MTKPTDLPRFAVNSTTLPIAGTANKIALDAARINTGFDYTDRPLAQEENWWRNNVYLWIEELNNEGILFWDASTTYPIGAYVKGSDFNIYKAVALQSGNNPVGDGGANWVDYKSVVSPSASTTVQGIVELATNTEVNTGTDTSRAITPSGLSNRTATTTRTGVIELATQAEADTGTDATRAITPSTLANWSGIPSPNTGSIASDGYWVDSATGLKVAWGFQNWTTGAGNFETITFPTTFTTTFQVFTTGYDTTSGDNANLNVRNITTTQAEVWNPNGASATNGVMFLVIGT